jgi:hypothetical protein
MKPRKRAVPRRKAPSKQKRQQAISLLSKWATKRERVSFTEQSSGLQHPGVITRLSLSDEPEFMFIANSGAHLLIFPMLWTAVEVEVWEKIPSESLRVTEHFRKYSIALRAKSKGEDASTKAAKEQLLLWSRLQTRELYIAVSGRSFPILAFFGSIDGPRDDAYVITQRDRAFCIIFSMSAARAEVGKVDDQVMIEVTDRSTGTYMVISEKELSAADLADRFKLRGSAVN